MYAPLLGLPKISLSHSQKKTRVLSLALDGKIGGMSAGKSNKHISDILSSKAVRAPTDEDNQLQVDVNIEDYFRLAELKVSL